MTSQSQLFDPTSPPQLYLLKKKQFSCQIDSIAVNQVIKDGETVVSAGEMYEMGFFSPANSNNRYLGIWYKKIATGTVVWVANGDLPLSNTSGTFKVTNEGLLQISCCGDTIIWSSTSSALVRYINPVAQLLDTGNFVVRDGNSTDETNFIWQSFDYPGDILLPGMKLGKDFVTGISRNLTSWKSPNDPSIDCQVPEDFRKIRGMKFPDTRKSWYNQSMTLGECEMACRKNCSCTAYANIDIRRGGSGCILWFGELMDLKVCEESQDLYIRMPVSLLRDDGLTVSESDTNKMIRVLTITFSISLVLLGLSLAAYVRNKRKKRSSTKGRGRRVHALDKKYSNVENDDLDLNFISLSKVVKATNNFSIDNKLGQGGFGPVYKGVLENGQEVAVKKLSETSQQGYEEFYNEVVCVARLQHRNLVKLLGYCMDGDERILIYEYLANKSLDLYLFDETKSSMLKWPLRFDIIHGIAKGILYLHQDSRHRIIHRDLKASNILLDRDMNPKISDFGLAREFGGDQIAAKTVKVVGTYGYISPEYAIHGRISVKSDVFSFGVLVLEMVSGKKNRGFSHENVGDNLLGHAWRLYREGKSLELMSPCLRDSCIVSEVERTIHVGLLCVQNLAEDRPTMSSVVMMLDDEGALPPPKEPAFFVGEGLPNSTPFLAGVDEATITLLEPR
ncbi:G-type lectin S-receptor-like serine/threonine-protein kinase At4g27290 isoform X7 [Cynara cardunculus var. scolymus]|uniref:G-type lectin S-receptor-like serine/threonine-protein kinase At4g27290 isoform X7 n=1 Tax=Cynara cardunculus var. scolymus TaxID=59895 RepID=UPI000D624B8D|nr:G-type lectin S-receptor-like serine/threonine-protein kinase At4g27290 isoform X7 [Cynara cardunculus var. scolymus]